MVPGYEADDVIGSVARRCEKEGFTVYMVTPDKDYGQLITDRIFQYKPGKSGSEIEIVDRKAICEKYGISSPSQVIDMLTICGDASDNVPGVKGVGEVGAGKLISTYGSVENIYAHLDCLTPRQRAAFLEAKDHIDMSHTLVTIRTDVEVDLDMRDTAVTKDYSPEIAELFTRYEFSSLSRYISHVAAESKAGNASLEIREVEPAEFCRLAAGTRLASLVPVLSGDGVFSNVVRLTAATVSDGTNWCASGDCRDFIGIIEDKDIKKCGYDLKALVNALENSGMKLEGQLFDIELMHYLVNPEKSHKIEILAMSYLGIMLDAAAGTPVQKSLFEMDEKKPVESGNMEAVVDVLLTGKIMEDVRRLGAEQLYEKIEEPLIRVLAAMEKTGVKVDLQQLHEYAAGLRKELDERQERIREMAGEPELNISSPMQVGIVLFEKLALDPKAKKSSHRHFYRQMLELPSAVTLRLNLKSRRQGEKVLQMPGNLISSASIDLALVGLFQPATVASVPLKDT